ncbi:unnamed protein product [Somion occarium]|uniref:DUF6533 domain-containing protein n=1 Tax=Somion occarium TaxID=3059160 RepID=A0ABP1CSY9_9APHY
MSQADTGMSDVEFLALVAEKVFEMRIANTFAVAATTLLIFDYLLTLSEEIKCIWKRKFTGVTILFFINRYVTLMYRILMIVQMVSFDNQTESTANAGWYQYLIFICSCASVLRFCEGLVIILEVTAAAFMAIRMYAIWNGDRRVFAVVFILGLVTPAINIYYYTTLSVIALPQPLVGCGEEVDLHTPIAISVFNRVFAIGLDAFILILTWAKTAGIMRSLASVHIRTSLTTMLLRDGTVYFAFLLVLNVANLVAISYNIFGALPALTDVVTSILITRFLLNLRGVYSSNGATTSFDFDKSMSDVRFANASDVVGNLGAPLNSVLDNEEDERYFVAEDPLLAGLPTSTLPTENEVDTVVDDFDDASVIDIKADYDHV